MKKYKIFFVGKQEHIHEDIAQYDENGVLLNADKKDEFFRL